MKRSPNPRIAIHTAKVDLANKCLSPITNKYLSIHNNKRTIKKVKITPSSTVQDLLKANKLNEVKPEELLKNFARIPNRNIKKSAQIIPSLHLNFPLLWTQLALLAFGAEENKKLYQIVVNVQDKLLNKAIKVMNNPKSNKTLIDTLLKNTTQKLPRDFKYWAVFEKGSKQDGNHIHIITALDSHDEKILRNALSNFEIVRFKDDTSIDGNKSHIDIDIGAAYYFAKFINKRYYGSNNLFVTPALRKEARVLESKYRDFIAENKPFLLDDEKAIHRSIQAHEQRRIDARPKTYEEWEEQTLNQPTEELDTTVYWQDIDYK
jgi:hypothetical protein